MEEAERIAWAEHGSTKIAVISGRFYKLSFSEPLSKTEQFHLL